MRIINFGHLVTVASLLMVSTGIAETQTSNSPVRPRTIVTTDPELDDSNSLVRFLLYAAEVQTEGLIYASSQFHWRGDGKGTLFSVPESRVFPRRRQPLPVHVLAMETGRTLHRRRCRHLRPGLFESQGARSELPDSRVSAIEDS